MHLLDNATNDDDDDNDMQHGPPAPATGSIPHSRTKRNPKPTPITAPALACGGGGSWKEAWGRDRQANMQPSDIYQQPPSSAGYIRAFARLSLLTALDVSGDMAQWGRSK